MKIEKGTVDLGMAKRMRCANLKFLPFTVWEEFLGKTHFLFYIIDIINIIVIVIVSIIIIITIGLLQF